MKGYQPRTNIEKDGNGSLHAGLHNILKRLKTYFHQLLNVHDTDNIKQM
jgi:hypothetical protein